MQHSNVTLALNAKVTRLLTDRSAWEISEVFQLLERDRWSVRTMVCDGCAQNITGSLSQLPGVHEVKPRVAQKHVVVRYEPARVGLDELKSAFDKAGFKAVET